MCVSGASVYCCLWYTCIVVCATYVHIVVCVLHVHSCVCGTCILLLVVHVYCCLWYMYIVACGYLCVVRLDKYTILESMCQ